MSAYEKKYRVNLTAAQKAMQFEDFLEFVRRERCISEYRGHSDTWDFMAKIVGVKQERKEWNSSLRKSDKEKEVEEALKSGKAVIASLYSGKGHIVKFQAIGDEGITMDDPYGKICRMADREYKVGTGYDKSAKNTNSTVKGDDNLLTWDDFNLKKKTSCSGEQIVTSSSETEYKETKNGKKYYYGRGAKIKYYCIYDK
jgi:hypothetical protein